MKKIFLHSLFAASAFSCVAASDQFLTSHDKPSSTPITSSKEELTKEYPFKKLTRLNHQIAFKLRDSLTENARYKDKNPIMDMLIKNGYKTIAFHRLTVQNNLEVLQRKEVILAVGEVLKGVVLENKPLYQLQLATQVGEADAEHFIDTFVEMISLELFELTYKNLLINAQNIATRS
jgi:hypothetical protein